MLEFPAMMMFLDWITLLSFSAVLNPNRWDKNVFISPVWYFTSLHISYLLFKAFIKVSLRWLERAAKIIFYRKTSHFLSHRFDILLHSTFLISYSKLFQSFNAFIRAGGKKDLVLNSWSRLSKNICWQI